MARVRINLGVVSARRLGNALTALLPGYDWEVVPSEELAPMTYSIEGVEGPDEAQAEKTIYLWLLFGHSDKAARLPT